MRYGRWNRLKNAQVSTRVDNRQHYLEVSIAFHEDLIDRLLANARVTELFIRHRHDESVFGRALRELEAQEIDRAAAHLIRWARAAGVGAKHDPELRLLAEFHVGAATTGVLSLLEKRATDRHAVARAIAVNADATMRATIAHLLPTRRKRIGTARKRP